MAHFLLDAVANSQTFETQHVVDLGKGGRRAMIKIRLIKISKILDMTSISIKNMKWKFCNMDQTSFKNIKDPSTPQYTDSHPCTLAAAFQKGQKGPGDPDQGSPNPEIIEMRGFWFLP